MSEQTIVGQLEHWKVSELLHFSNEHVQMLVFSIFNPGEDIDDETKDLVESKSIGIIPIAQNGSQMSGIIWSEKVERHIQYIFVYNWL